MTLEVGLIITAIVILIALSAFFSGSETAITAASRASMYALEKEGDNRAMLVNRLTKNPERLIGSILLGNNLVNILASALATSLFVHYFGQAGIVYATLAMTTLVVIFAEVLPKTYALSAPDHSALRVAPVLRILVTVFAPFSAAVQFIVRGLISRGANDSDDDATVISARDELRGAIDLHHLEGGVVKHDKDMLGGILDLKKLEVLDVMVHRTKMDALNADSPPQELIDEVLQSSHTRLPVWRDDPENFVGILHAKNLLRTVNRPDFDLTTLDVLELCSDAWFVPDSTSLNDQLNAFLKQRSHFALVVDEYGEVMGLITLEDILEEIVGQIADEHDIPDAGIRPQPDGTVNVDGTVPIRDLNRSMDWELPDDEATTVAGLVIHEAQTIPEPGQAFTFYGYRFEILRKQRNQITALRVRPLGNGSSSI